MTNRETIAKIKATDASDTIATGYVGDLILRESHARTAEVNRERLRGALEEEELRADDLVPDASADACFTRAIADARARSRIAEAIRVESDDPSASAWTVERETKRRALVRYSHGEGAARTTETCATITLDDAGELTREIVIPPRLLGALDVREAARIPDQVEGITRSFANLYRWQRDHVSAAEVRGAIDEVLVNECGGVRISGGYYVPPTGHALASKIARAVKSCGVGDVHVFPQHTLAIRETVSAGFESELRSLLSELREIVDSDAKTHRGTFERRVQAIGKLRGRVFLARTVLGELRERLEVACSEAEDAALKALHGDESGFETAERTTLEALAGNLPSWARSDEARAANGAEVEPAEAETNADEARFVEPSTEIGDLDFELF